MVLKVEYFMSSNISINAISLDSLAAKNNLQSLVDMQVGYKFI